MLPFVLLMVFVAVTVACEYKSSTRSTRRDRRCGFSMLSVLFAVQDSIPVKDPWPSSATQTT